MRTKKETIKLLIEEINEILGYNYLKIASRNGYTYIEEVETNNTILNSATTDKEVIIALKSFKEGIITEKNNLLIESYQRVFMVVTSTGNQFFCYLKQLNAVCKDLNEGYYSIYHFWNNKQEKITKKYLKELLTANNIKQEFFY